MSNTHKICLITGASRGIGHAILMRFAEAGFTVIGTATTEQGCERIKATLADAGHSGSAYVLDVNQHATIESVLGDIKQVYGAPSILINNAAVTADNLFLRMREEEWNRVIETNLNALFYVTKACVRDMLKERFGRIINISSVVGVTGNAGQTNYCASKAGMIGFTRSLALELGARNITVNAIAPGFIETDMTNALNEEQKKAIVDRIPMKRIGAPADIAEAALFLASEAGNYITGQTIHVNGGMYCG